MFFRIAWEFYGRYAPRLGSTASYSYIIGSKSCKNFNCLTRLFGTVFPRTFRLKPVCERVYSTPPPRLCPDGAVLSLRSSSCGLLGGCLPPRRYCSSGSSNPNLFLESVKRKQAVTLLYAHELKYFGIYNIFGVVLFVGFTWWSYHIYANVVLDKVEDTAINEDDSYYPVYRKIGVEKYRWLISGGIFFAGFFGLLFILRYTLRSVQSLQLLGDGVTLEISVKNIIGRTRTRRIPLQHAYADPVGVRDVVAEVETCVLLVKDQRVSYILDHGGTVLERSMFTKLLSSRKPFLAAMEAGTT